MNAEDDVLLSINTAYQVLLRMRPHFQKTPDYILRMSIEQRQSVRLKKNSNNAAKTRLKRDAQLNSIVVLIRFLTLFYFKYTVQRI